LRHYSVVLKQRSRLNALIAPGAEDALLVEELRQCERRFGFLFRRYEDEFFWWEIVILGRKLTYCLCGTLMVVGPGRKWVQNITGWRSSRNEARLNSVSGLVSNLSCSTNQNVAIKKQKYGLYPVHYKSSQPLSQSRREL